MNYLSKNGFSTSEALCLAMLLNEAADEYAGHTCNDHVVRFGEGHADVVAEAIAHCRRTLDGAGSSELSSLVEDEDGYFIYDDWLMRYLAERARAWANPENGRAAVAAPSELRVLIDLLETLIADDYGFCSNEPDEEDCVLPIGEENNALLTAATLAADREEAEAIVAQIASAKDYAFAYSLDVFNWLVQRARQIAA